MAQFPIMPVNVSLLLADCENMKPGPFGGYCRLLFQLWLAGGKLPYDPKALRELMHFSNQQWRRWWPKIASNLEVSGGYVSQKRLTATWLEILAKRRKHAHAANVKWKLWRDANAYALHMHGTSNAYAKNKEERKKDLETESVAPATAVPVSEGAGVAQSGQPTSQGNGRCEIGTAELAALMASKKRR